MSAWTTIILVIAGAMGGGLIGAFIVAIVMSNRLQRAREETGRLRRDLRVTAEQVAPHCTSTTKTGAPCESTVGIVDGLCAIHRRTAA